MGFHTISKATVKIGSIPIVICCYVMIFASFTCLIHYSTSPLTSTFLPWTPYPPPFPLPPSSLPPDQGLDLPATTTTISPILPDAVPLPDIAPVLDKSRLTEIWYSSGRWCMSPPPIVSPPPSLHPEEVTSIAPVCLTLAEFPWDGRPPCGGIRQGYARFWDLTPRYQCQPRGSPEQRPCKKFWKSGVWPLPPQNTG